MIVSMTGYGEGVASNDAATVTSEVRSVNHRFLDLSFKVPRILQAHERDMKEIVRKHLARGRVYVTVTIEMEHRADSVAIDARVMAEYLNQLRDFARAHNLPGDVDINTLVQMPDVVRVREAEPGDDVVWPLVRKSLADALGANCAMRQEEGRTLKADLAARMTSLGEVVARVEALSPGVSRKHAEALRKRIDQLVGDAKVSEERLVSEIAVMADRLDFTEELTRLRSHESQFNATLSNGGEVSKKLTYLLQEIHREATTIGSKASDSEVIQQVVVLKEETEKIREQIQNVE